MDGNHPRLESVEFEDWGASRIDGKFDVDPRTLIYGADKDALREIVDVVRRRRNLTETALLTRDANPVGGEARKDLLRQQTFSLLVL